MRTVLCTVILAVVLGLSYPAEAQLRNSVPDKRAPVKVLNEGPSGFSLNKLFSPEHFRMGHSYEMSVSSFGGGAHSLGQYTNTMQWQFNNKLAARVDVAFKHSLFGQQALSKGPNSSSLADHVYLRNAEIAYRPTKNMQFRLSVRQSPYGSYMSPYGSYNRFGGGASYSHEPLFFKSVN